MTILGWRLRRALPPPPPPVPTRMVDTIECSDFVLLAMRTKRHGMKHHDSDGWKPVYNWKTAKVASQLVTMCQQV